MKDIKWKILLIPVLIGVLLYIANSTLLKIVFTLWPATITLTFGRGSWWLDEGWFVKAVYVGLIAPLIEELFFRRIILQHFIFRRQATLGLIVSSLTFGLYHMAFGWGVGKTVDMIIVGLVFGLLYMKYGFRGSLLAHYANNACAVAAML